MASRNYGKNLVAFAAHVSWLAERLDKTDELKRADEQNPLFQIVMLIANEVLPIFQEFSPVDTGMLQSYHRVAEGTIEASGDHVTATAIIDIDPDRSRENPKWGGYPVDYGYDYHVERYPWFNYAATASRPIFDSIVDAQFRSWLEVLL